MENIHPKYNKFRLDVRTNLQIRVIHQWSSLPREPPEISEEEILKGRLDNILKIVQQINL